MGYFFSIIQIQVPKVDSLGGRRFSLSAVVQKSILYTRWWKGLRLEMNPQMRPHWCMKLDTLYTFIYRSITATHIFEMLYMTKNVVWITRLFVKLAIDWLCIHWPSGLGNTYFRAMVIIMVDIVEQDYDLFDKASNEVYVLDDLCKVGMDFTICV